MFASSEYIKMNTSTPTDYKNPNPFTYTENGVDNNMTLTLCRQGWGISELFENEAKESGPSSVGGWQFSS